MTANALTLTRQHTTQLTPAKAMTRSIRGENRTPHHNRESRYRRPRSLCTANRGGFGDSHGSRSTATHHDLTARPRHTFPDEVAIHGPHSRPTPTPHIQVQP